MSGKNKWRRLKTKETKFDALNKVKTFYCATAVAAIIIIAPHRPRLQFPGGHTKTGWTVYTIHADCDSTSTHWFPTKGAAKRWAEKTFSL